MRWLSRAARVAVLPLIFVMVGGASAQTAAPGPSHDAMRAEHAYVLGVQAALWGRPLLEYLNTNYGAVKSGASYLNYLRKFDKQRRTGTL